MSCVLEFVCLVFAYACTSGKEFFFKSNLFLYSLHYAEACNEFAGPISASLRPGNIASFEETSQRWRVVGNTVSDLTGPRFEPQTSRSIDECVTARPIENSLFADNSSKIVFRWYRDGEELLNSDPNVRIESDGTLTLFVVTRADNGQYICEAENERGVVTEVTNVKVHGKKNWLQ